MIEVLQIAGRFSSRFRRALDGLAFPASLSERVHRVAIALNVDKSIAISYLAGDVLPDYKTLFSICTLTNKQPGYFLDANLPDSDLSLVKVIQPIGSGPPIAMEIHERFMYTGYISPATTFWYFTAYEDLPIGIINGDVVITSKQERSGPPMIKDRYYASDRDNTIHIFECTEATKSSAILRSLNDKHTRIVPISHKAATAIPAGDSHFGLIIGILRGHSNLRRLRATTD